MTGAGLLLAALLTTTAALNGWSESPAEEKARGEEMLRRARQDLAAANQIYESSLKAAQAAQRDQELASQKRLEARQLQREAFLLIHDPNRMQAAELRAQAESKALQVKSEEAELARLEALLAHEKKVVAATESAAEKMRDAASHESNPAKKAELTKMAEGLTKQHTEEFGRGAAIVKRTLPVKAEISELNAAISQLNEEAQRLAPPEK